MKKQTQLENLARNKTFDDQKKKGLIVRIMTKHMENEEIKRKKEELEILKRRNNDFIRNNGIFKSMNLPEPYASKP